ncbi:MAG: aldo/keto reductase family oxidoreductase [Edaphobacter sp.]|uniref:aldo/keto reductase family oxidoreductase n=1 Tax=Edaphobacter sp. TaxID=1934404 RepID=UPI0023A06DF0|nr:aldo/keto reductase family oxidoreductase [Edaphobacter sp.]MDE1176686.1 aldo/keto reductase family oxidoreductase [Edaphobacter sp.]
MSTPANLAGTFTFPGTDLTVHRMGYGAMQLAGPHVFGPPRDRDEAVAVLREAIETGIDHIDTSDFYGPHVTNQIIKEALHPYRDNLVIVTKLGARRDEKGAWLPAQSRQELIDGAHSNLRNLGLDALDIVNLRAFNPDDISRPGDFSIAEQVSTLAELKQQGLIRHIGLSNVSAKQLKEAQAIAPIVCIQNLYNVALREDDAFLDQLTAEGIAFVPFFPLGGFTPLQSSTLDDVAKSLNATPMQTALAWLLHRAPNMLLIPGTSSRGHLRENIAAASINLPAESLKTLDGIAAEARA